MASDGAAFEFINRMAFICCSVLNLNESGLEFYHTDKPFHAKRKERESPQTDNSTHTFGAAGAGAVHTDQHVPQDSPALKSLHVGNDSGHGQLTPPPKSWLQFLFVGLPARTMSPLCTEGKPAHGPLMRRMARRWKHFQIAVLTMSIE